MRRRFCHIVAHGDNFAIGAKGGMPWHLPEDLKYFKKITAGHAVVMGRKTFDSIGRPLPARLNIVISRSMEDREGLVVARSWHEVKELLAAREDWPETVFVIGGAMLYNESMPDIVGAYVTRVPMSPEADTFYPDISQIGFVRKTVEIGSSEPQLSYQYWER